MCHRKMVNVENEQEASPNIRKQIKEKIQQTWKTKRCGKQMIMVKM